MWILDELSCCIHKYDFKKISPYFVMCFVFSFAVSEILSGESREAIVENIHSKLLEVGQKVKEGAIPIELYYITKVTKLSTFTIYNRTQLHCGKTSTATCQQCFGTKSGTKSERRSHSHRTTLRY